MNKLNRTKRTAAAGISFLILLVLLAFPVFAAQGSWQQEPYSGRWRWQTPDGYYYSSCWQWIDGNGDGICECYYFDPEGYCLQGTQTPDGYYVNADGAWTVNGTVQTRSSAELKAIASYSDYEGVFGDDHGDVTVIGSVDGWRNGRYLVGSHNQQVNPCLDKAVNLLDLSLIAIVCRGKAQIHVIVEIGSNLQFRVLLITPDVIRALRYSDSISFLILRA